MNLNRLAATVAALALVVCVARGEDVTIEYRLTISHPETGVGHVEMHISGLQSKGFRLLRANTAVPGWFDGVKAVSAAAADKTCKVMPVDNGFYVTTDGAAGVAVTYDIKPGEAGDIGHIGLITEEYAALDGSMVFLAPGDEQKIKERRVHVRRAAVMAPGDRVETVAGRLPSGRVLGPDQPPTRQVSHMLWRFRGGENARRRQHAGGPYAFVVPEGRGRLSLADAGKNIPADLEHTRI